MNELIQDVAGVINSLKILNLLSDDAVSTTVYFENDSGMCELTLHIASTISTLDLCMEMFRTLSNKKGYKYCDDYEFDSEYSDCAMLQVVLCKA